MSNAHTTTATATHAVAKGFSDYYAGKIIRIDPDGTVYIKPRNGHSSTLLAGTYRLITR